MIQKTLLLFQLFLAVCAFYVLLHYSGNLRFVASLAFLVAMFVVAKAEGSFSKDSDSQNRHAAREPENDRAKTTNQQLDCLLKSNNVLLLTDAIHYLMEDVGLTVSGAPEHRSVDRLIRIPGLEVTLGVKVIGDVAELNASWGGWDELSRFDLGKGANQRLLIISGNCAEGKGDGQHRYKSFSRSTRELLTARHLVAMTTLTLGKIYLLCKRKRLDRKALFHGIQHHPGGVFRQEVSGA